MENVLSVQGQFPVESKDVLQVTVNCKADEKVVGDKSITCYGGTHFIYSKSPGCLPQGLKLSTLNNTEIIMCNEWYNNNQSNNATIKTNYKSIKIV